MALVSDFGAQLWQTRLNMKAVLGFSLLKYVGINGCWEDGSQSAFVFHFVLIDFSILWRAQAWWASSGG